jgi:cell division protease FtsH
VLLGGRAAEEVVFHDMSTGAQDDLQRASDIARRMVTELGMSEQLGPYTVEHERQPLFLSNGYPNAKTYSEAMAQSVDHEAQSIVEQMYQRAHHLLTGHRDKLETLAQYLLKHEAIDQATLATLLGELRPNQEAQLIDS